MDSTEVRDDGSTTSATTAQPDAALHGDAAVVVPDQPDDDPPADDPPAVDPPTDAAQTDDDPPTDAAQTEDDPTDADQPDDDPPADAALTDAALDGIFGQVLALRGAGIAHGALSTETIVVDEDECAGLVDLRAATTVASTDQLDRDLAAAMAAAALWPDRTASRPPRRGWCRSRPWSPCSVPATGRPRPGGFAVVAGEEVDPLPALRAKGAEDVGIEVPKLIEPRRISWVTLVLVLGTLIGGWALIGVLVNVTHSWSTITGAKWGWVAVVFVLSQAGLPRPGLDNGRFGHRHDALRPDSSSLEVANTFRGPWPAWAPWRAGDPGPLLPAAGLRRHPRRQLRCAGVPHGQLDREGRLSS